MNKKPRVLISLLGMDQHEVGAIAVITMLRDAGIEVIYSGPFNLPPMIVKTAVEEAVDVIGLSCYSWEYLYHVPELVQLLEKDNIKIPVIIGGGIITPSDAEMLKKKGVSAVFGPSSTREEIVPAVINLARTS